LRVLPCIFAIKPSKVVKVVKVPKVVIVKVVKVVKKIRPTKVVSLIVVGVTHRDDASRHSILIPQIPKVVNL
jgi:hypothetical protein